MARALAVVRPEHLQWVEHHASGSAALGADLDDLHRDAELVRQVVGKAHVLAHGGAIKGDELAAGGHHRRRHALQRVRLARAGLSDHADAPRPVVGRAVGRFDQHGVVRPVSVVTPSSSPLSWPTWSVVHGAGDARSPASRYCT